MHKKKTIIETLNKNLIDQQILKGHPVVYVGSGIDWEYPICFGGRDIILVDPILKESKMIDKLKDRIKDAIGLEPEESKGKLQFQLNSGGGNEMVSIKLEPALYGTPEEVTRLQPDEREVIARLKSYIQANDPLIAEDIKEEFRTQSGRFAPDYLPPEKERLPRFQPPNKIGMLLGFQFTGTGIEIDNDREAMNNIVNGGYALSNSALGNTMIRQFRGKEEEKYTFFTPEEKLQLKQNKWREQGYDLIPLETVEDTLIKKNVTPSPAS